MKDSSVNKSVLLFQRLIVKWFGEKARDLPWRKTSDPYKIWVSEVMLQQTGVSTVIPYYERFLKKFPSVEDLASGSEAEVLKLWEGLGYYRRAKNLRLGAKLIVEKFWGRFPDSRESLLLVPGIGPYSAGAILSIAFRKQAPALDGNLIRVYARYYGIRDFVNEAKTLKALWKIASEHSPERREIIREFTEGMMELGALVCTPKNPACSDCPVQSSCVAKAKGLVGVLPRKKAERSREKLFEQIVILRRGSKMAFLPKGSDPKYPDFVRLPFESLKKAPRLKSDMKTFKYSVTHRDFQVFLSQDTKTKFRNLIWLDRGEISAALLPAIDRKILARGGVEPPT